MKLVKPAKGRAGRVRLYSGNLPVTAGPEGFARVDAVRPGVGENPPIPDHDEAPVGQKGKGRSRHVRNKMWRPKLVSAFVQVNVAGLPITQKSLVVAKAPSGLDVGGVAAKQGLMKTKKSLRSNYMLWCVEQIRRNSVSPVIINAKSTGAGTNAGNKAPDGLSVTRSKTGSK